MRLTHHHRSGQFIAQESHLADVLCHRHLFFLGRGERNSRVDGARPLCRGEVALDHLHVSFAVLHAVT
jgi:hypothetical protein